MAKKTSTKKRKYISKTITKKFPKAVVEQPYYYTYKSPEYTMVDLETQADFDKLYKHFVKVVKEFDPKIEFDEKKMYYMAMNAEYLKLKVAFEEELKKTQIDYATVVMWVLYIKSKKNGDHLEFVFKREKSSTQMIEWDLSNVKIGSRFDGKKILIAKKIFASDVLPNIDKHMLNFLDYVQTGIINRYNSHKKWREWAYLTYPAVEVTSNILGLTVCPKLDIWDEAWNEYEKARKIYLDAAGSLIKVHKKYITEEQGYNEYFDYLTKALSHIERSNAGLDTAIKKMNTYREKNLLGAGRAIVGLTVIKNVSFTLLKELIKAKLRIVSPAAAASIDTGVKGLEELVTRLSEKANLGTDFDPKDFMIVIGSEFAASYAGNLASKWTGDWLKKKFFDDKNNAIIKEIFSGEKFDYTKKLLAKWGMPIGTDDQVKKLIHSQLKYRLLEDGLKRVPKDTVKGVVTSVINRFYNKKKRPSQAEFDIQVQEALWSKIWANPLWKSILSEACKQVALGIKS